MPSADETITMMTMTKDQAERARVLLMEINRCLLSPTNKNKSSRSNQLRRSAKDWLDNLKVKFDEQAARNHHFLNEVIINFVDDDQKREVSLRSAIRRVDDFLEIVSSCRGFSDIVSRAQRVRNRIVSTMEAENMEKA